jgi:predicted nuclease of predicted toxin-antitoxin system
MRFLVDECTGPAVARWLCDQGYDVLSVYEQARGIDDAEVISLALAEERILITNDKDFGEIVYRERRLHQGIILLRLQNANPTAKIAALTHLLANHADKLEGSFVVVTEKQARFAKLLP